MASTRRRFGNMAYDRHTFKDRVEEHIVGAYLEFYKSRLAAKNGRTKRVAHWMPEVRDLLDRLDFVIVRHEVRGFRDKRRAIDQVIDVVRRRDQNMRAGAETVVKRDYGMRKLLVHLDDRDCDAFWALVVNAGESGLAAKS